jgi:hypothetical protein
LWWKNPTDGMDEPIRIERCILFSLFFFIILYIIIRFDQLWWRNPTDGMDEPIRVERCILFSLFFL